MVIIIAEKEDITPAYPDRGMEMKILFSLFVLVSVFLTGSLSEAGSVVISTGEYPPYCGRCLPRQGFINDVVLRSFNKAGFSVEFKYYPWARSFKLVETGVVPAVSYIYDTLKRREQYFVSDVIAIEEMLFLLNEESELKKGGLKEALKGLKIGLVQGYSHPDALVELINDKSVKVEFAIDDLQNIAKLIKGRVNAILISKDLGKLILDQEFPDREVDVYFDRSFIFEQKAVLGFSRINPGAHPLLTKFNEGLKVLKESDEFDKMVMELQDGGYSDCQ